MYRIPVYCPKHLIAWLAYSAQTNLGCEVKIALVFIHYSSSIKLGSQSKPWAASCRDKHWYHQNFMVQPIHWYCGRVTAVRSCHGQFQGMRPCLHPRNLITAHPILFEMNRIDDSWEPSLPGKGLRPCWLRGGRTCTPDSVAGAPGASGLGRTQAHSPIG